ncbi:MAG: N-acetyl-gamma-glutamyl-phosphate reductase [Actinobacteria bacterium]|nr:N-acetyl-gamma-glutamyl-phosphate reductase [Actinomycetota bacterium]
MKSKLKAAVIGGSGFTGLELLKILNNHQMIEMSFTTSKTYDGMDVSEVFPSYSDSSRIYSTTEKQKNTKKLKFTIIDKISKNELSETDIIFLCLPPLHSMEFVSNYLLDFKGKIIDLGSDFRIHDPASFKTWYGTEHKIKNILSDFTYGLPEIYKEKIASSRLIANPGCYPTSILLALTPVLRDGSLIIEDINIDSKSGVTGAGRKVKPEYLFCSIDENFFAYSVLAHRHIGEIEQEIENLAKKNFKISFTPHLIPVNRGIFTSIYCKIALKNKEIGSVNMEPGKIINSILKSYEEFYKSSIFVKFLGQKIPQLKDVVGTNMCQIGTVFDDRTGTLKIFSVLDNLLKGAAGQAVQNMNIMFGFNEAEGLTGYGLFS